MGGEKGEPRGPGKKKQARQQMYNKPKPTSHMHTNKNPVQKAQTKNHYEDNQDNRCIGPDQLQKRLALEGRMSNKAGI